MSGHKEVCTRCNAALNSGHTIWLELDQRTGTYTAARVPEPHSQGEFPFGPDCARIEQKKHDAAVSAAKATP